MASPSSYAAAASSDDRKEENQNLWFNRYSQFCLNVKPGWELILGPKAKLPFPHQPGKYYCRISDDYSGVDICADEDKFLTNTRFLVVDDDPRVGYGVTTQHTFGRDDAEGCICPGYSSSSEEGGGGGETETTENGSVKVDIDCLLKEKIDRSDCLYLGNPQPSFQPLVLEPLIEKQVYCLKSGYEVEGYVFAVGIQGACLDSFHSNEGMYEIAVHVYNKGLTLLGSQNELNWDWR